MAMFLWRPVVSPEWEIRDTFTDANGTLLSNHTPEASPGGVNWTNVTPDLGPPVAGTTTIQGNQAAISADAEGVLIDSGQSDVDITIDITFGAGSRCGVVVRGAGVGEMLVFRMRQPESLIELTDWAGGTPTIIGTSQPFTFVNGQTYAIRVQASIQTITAWIDGVQVVQETGVALHQTSTGQGFVSFGSSLDERYDNFFAGAIRSLNREDTQPRSKVAGAGVASRIRRGTVFADRIR